MVLHDYEQAVELHDEHANRQNSHQRLKDRGHRETDCTATTTRPIAPRPAGFRQAFYRVTECFPTFSARKRHKTV